MKLWPKVLNRIERQAWDTRRAWNYLRFLLFETPRHRGVEIGKGVTFNVPVKGGQGTLRVGDDTMLGFPLAYRLGDGGIMLQTRTVEAEIAIGRRNGFSNNTVLCAVQSIRIGDNCRIGDGVAIYDADFHEVNPATRDRSLGVVKPVVIGNNVWIGSRVMVLKGVTIGENSVIGAMSLVTKEVPPNSIAAGVPARVVRTIP
jgi:maltose O-acetyltransferase